MEKHAIRETDKDAQASAGWVSYIRVMEFCEIYMDIECIDLDKAHVCLECLKKNRKEKKDNALNCIILFQISQPS